MAEIVADASAFVRVLTGGPGVDRYGRAFAQATDVHVPELCDVEVLGAVREAVLQGRMPSDRAERLLIDYLSAPIRRHRHLGLIPRAYELRENVSAADAMYVALAERLGAALVTADRRLARAVARHTNVPVLP